MRNKSEINTVPESIELFQDKYRDKSIRFYDKGDHYDLLFNSEFEGANQESPVYTDLLMDLKDADKSKEIHLWIHSCGGDCSTLMLIDQQLNEFEYIVTIGLGEIDSAGFMLWSKGHERYLSPLTLCMYHSLSTGNYGKASEMKEYSEFMTRYQSIFEVSAKDILTEEELEKGRYTEIWFLGQELIERKKAIDYKNYSKRNKLEPVEAYRINGDIYLKNEDATYMKVEEASNPITKKEVMKSYFFDNINELKKLSEELGEEFLEFINNWICLKNNLIIKDGWISDNLLLEEWKGFTNNDIKIKELKDKIEIWCKNFTTNLFFEKEKIKNGKKGFIIKVIGKETDEQTKNVNLSNL